VSATYNDVALSNASVHKLTVEEDVKPGSSVGVVAAVGSVAPKTKTPPKAASSVESVPYN